MSIGLELFAQVVESAKRPHHVANVHCGHVDRCGGPSGGPSPRSVPPMQFAGARKNRFIPTKDDVVDDAVEVDGGDALSNPLMAHERWRMGPDFEVVGEQEYVRDALTEGS